MSTLQMDLVVHRLAVRDATRTEADIQADIYTLLTFGDLALNTDQVVRLEAQTADGTHRRLDIEVGHAVIEVKKDLRPLTIRRDAEAQLAGYVLDQSERFERRYVGILTDGVEWALYDAREDRLVEVGTLTLTGSDADADRLLAWLGAVLATERDVKPTPAEIGRRLGAQSPAYLLDHAELVALYEQGSSIPEVALKRTLWARLLRTAFGSAFRDDDTTFIDHSLLVLTAEIIAHAVVGIDVSATGGLTADNLVAGTAFEGAQIHGAVEADFFDWVLKVDGGRAFVRTLADRISRFNWSNVEHDVLKHLYESVIPAQARAGLGEYYTPDWLARSIVSDTVTDPLNQRVLDPSCGSGTFVFHAARVYLEAAEGVGRSLEEAISGLVTHVIGMDIHPVAVTLARVTYLLAIGTSRMRDPHRPPFAVPVYLGDSLQWEQNRDLFSTDETISISTTSDDLTGEGGGTLFDDNLIFPREVLADADAFDRLVSDMADKALDTSNTYDRNLMGPVLGRHKVPTRHHHRLIETFTTMRALARTGRNHIWGYYVRNLIRPIWLTEQANRVDVLVGNPPWLRYSKMPAPMQERYKALARPRQLLTGALGASGRDLSTLFVARAVELYLSDDGVFAFVMPHGTLTRLPHTGFRSGQWSPHNADTATLDVAFNSSWDLTRAPTGFPMVSCVIRGKRTLTRGTRMPADVTAWTPVSHGRGEAPVQFQHTPATVHAVDAASDLPTSPYKRVFRQGAVLVPRVLSLVQDAPAGPLGAGAGRRKVVSRRTTTEKVPWKDVTSLEGSVESEFVRPVHLGETVAPYRALEPLHAVLPVTNTGVMARPEIDARSGLSAWWADAEARWDATKSAADRSKFLDRINFHNQLSAQFPTAAERVVYSASGNTLAAARVSDSTAVIEHKLYWAPVSSTAEGRYLVGILNSSALLHRVSPLQAVGLFGPRDFDKNVFSVPFGRFEERDVLHQKLVRLVEDAEIAAGQVLTTGAFQADRAAIREALSVAGLAASIDAIVQQILPAVIVDPN